MPSSERSSNGSQQPKEEEETPLDDDSECFMCFVLHKRGFVTHSAKDCSSRAQFNRKLNDPRSRSELIERINEKSRSAKSDQVSDSTSAKMNSPNPRNELSMQGQRGPLPNAQHIPQQMQQQMHPMQQRQQHSVREHREPFSHQNVMSSQTSGEFLNPWQLQTSMQGGSTGYNQNLFNSFHLNTTTKLGLEMLTSQ